MSVNSRRLYKSGHPVTHAIKSKKGPWYTALCGPVEMKGAYFSKYLLTVKSTYTYHVGDVDCVSCKSHECFDLWVIGHTDI